MKQIPTSILTLGAGIIITFISLWVGQNHGLLPVQASEQAPLVDGFFNIMVTIATALFLVVEGAILIFVIKFRRQPGDDTDGLPIKGNFPLEIFWMAIPAMIVIGLGIYSVEVYQQMGGFVTADGMAHNHGAMSATSLNTDKTIEDSAIAPHASFGIGATPDEQGVAADLVVNVTGLQYAWIFNYADGLTAGELHIPVGKDVQINLAAQDVIHSLWIPQFRLKQDALPGTKTELRFIATKTGTFPIVCAELCGSYHGSMRSQVIVHTPDEYEHWLAENRITQAAFEQAHTHTHYALAIKSDQY